MNRPEMFLCMDANNAYVSLNGGLKRKKNEYVTSMYSLSRAIINRHALKIAICEYFHGWRFCRYGDLNNEFKKSCFF